ncbi:MAG: hypothetical protein RIQ89_1922, partial [Bacteroidota bacterium]
MCKYILRFASSLLVFLTGFLSASSQNCTVNAGVDTTVCANAVFTITGSTAGLFAANPNYYWVQLSGPPATIVSPNAQTTQILGLAGGVGVFQFQATCQDGIRVTDNVSVTAQAALITPAAGPDQQNCSTGTFTLAANAAGPGSTGTWTVASGGGVSFANANSATSNVTISSNGVKVLVWSISSGACVLRDTMSISILAPNSVTAGSDITVACSGNSTTLSGSDPGISPQSGVWSFISGPNTPVFGNITSATSSLGNLVPGTYTLQWNVSGPCLTGSDQVIVTVTNIDASLNVGGNTQVFCDGRTSVSLNGTSLLAGETVLWTQTSGPAGPTIVSPTSPSTLVTGLNGTSNYTFTYTKTKGTCSSSGSYNIRYNASYSLSPSARDTTLTCGTTSVTVPLSIVTSGSTSGFSASVIFISGPNTPSTSNNQSGSTINYTFSGMVAGTYVYQLIATNSCSSQVAQLTIRVSTPPSSSNAGSDQILACNVTSTTLLGSNPSSGTGFWYQGSGPNAATIANPLLRNTAVSGLIPGDYFFRWIITNGVSCGFRYDNVLIRVAGGSVTAANAGLDQNVCFNSPVQLAGNTPGSGQTGTWTVSPSAGVTFNNANAPNAIASGLAASTVYTFTWTIANACTSSANTALVTTTATQGAGTPSAGTDRCLSSGTTSVVLAGNTASPAGTTGTWSVIPAAGITFSNANSPTATASGLGSGTYRFIWTFTKSGCQSPSDTVLVTVSPTLTSNAGIDQNVCGTVATLAANAATPGTGTWVLESGAPVTITNVNSPTSTVSGLTTGSYSLSWNITNGGCPTVRDTVILSVTLPPTTAAAGTDIAVCNSSTTTLAANTPTSGLGNWQMITGPNNPTFSSITSPTATLTNLQTGTYTLVWTISSGGCSSSTDTLLITVRRSANAGSDQTICQVTSTTVLGNVLSGLQTGSWSQVSGPNTSTITAQGTTGATISNLIPGTYVLRWSVSGGGCSSTDDMQIIVNQPPTTANAGTDIKICNGTTTTLAGNTPTFGTGAWTRQSGPNTPSISSSSNPAAVLSGMVTGTYVYRWTISNGGCVSSIDEVTIFNEVPAAAGPDQSLCNVTSTVLSGNNPLGGGTGTWTLVSGPSVPSFANVNAGTTNVTNLTVGTYTFRWTIVSSPCPNTTDDIIVTIAGNPTTASAGIDQTGLSLCGQTATTLNANTPTTGTGLWTIISGTGGTFISASNPSTGFNGVLGSTYTLQWTISNSPCPSTSDQVIIRFSPLPSTANAGIDLSQCKGQSTATLNAITPTIGVGSWAVVSGSATVTSPGSAISPVTGIPNIANNTILFEWTISSAPCNASKDTVQLTSINCAPTANSNSFSTSEDVLLSNTISGNDNDPDSDPLTFTVQTTTTNGVLVLNSNGTFNYTPSSNFSGSDQFIYTACDNGSPQLCDTAIVFITVTPVNDPPVVDNETITTPEDTPIGGDVTDAGDSDPIDGTTLVTITTPISGPAHGSIIVNSNGTYTYTPTANYNGLDTVIVSVCDQGTPLPALCINDTIFITVTPVNDPPVVDNETITTPEDTPIGGDLTDAGDSDPIEGTTLVIDTVLVVSPSNGTISINSDGSYIYTPDSNFFGFDTVVVNICDSGLPLPALCVYDTIFIIVTTNNDLPIANQDSVNTIEDTPVTFDVLVNDFDIEGLDTASISVISIQNGSATIDTITGLVTYTPDPNFVGVDTILYQVCDFGLPIACDTAYVIILVSPINDPPIANNDLNNTYLNTSVNGNMLTNDYDLEGDSIAVNTSPFITPSNGSVIVNLDGSYTYTPNTGFIGVDSFTYIICDNGSPSECDTAQVIITVIDQPSNTLNNLPPTANNDVTHTLINLPVNGCVICNDFDIDGDSILINTNPIVQPANGSITINANGSYTYVPNNGFVGNDTLIYEICDNGSPVLCDTASLIISIDQPIPSNGNNPPFAGDDAYNTNEDIPITGQLLDNDIDPDSDSLIINTSPISGPQNGILTLNNDGTFLYTPNSNYCGIDQFVYEICDEQTPALCAQATVYLTINCINDPIVANLDTALTSEDFPITISILDNDLDVENDIDTASIVIIDPPSFGTVTVDTITGAITYDPIPNFQGTDTLVYQVCDNGLPITCDTAMVIINIGPVNDPPQANDDFNVTYINTSISGIAVTNDFDIDGNLIFINTTPIINPSNGTVTINADGSYFYTPSSGFIGLDFFTYAICDNNNPSLCDSATVWITVIPQPSTDSSNIAPVANVDVTHTAVNVTVIGCLICNDYDVDGDSI